MNIMPWLVILLVIGQILTKKILLIISCHDNKMEASMSIQKMRIFLLNVQQMLVQLAIHIYSLIHLYYALCTFKVINTFSLQKCIFVTKILDY